MKAYKPFEEERIIGRRSLWDYVTKLKQKTRMSAGKYIKLNTGVDLEGNHIAIC